MNNKNKCEHKYDMCSVGYEMKRKTDDGKIEYYKKANFLCEKCGDYKEVEVDVYSK